jgi:glutathione synthase/RimK-type ligase-like ATP-grasp enzyme
MEIRFCILKNESFDSHAEWEVSCINKNINYDIVDITKNNWLENAINTKYSFYLTRPPGSISYFKTLYDERIYILHKILGKPIYPSYDEILVYENKKYLSYFLKAKSIPHPETWVFYNINEANQFAKNCKLPIVAKSSIGASGSGVKIISDRRQLEKYIQKIFTNKGIKRSFAPNLRKGNKLSRINNVIRNPFQFYQKIRTRYIASIRDPQRWFVIFQEYIKNNFEWRVVKIGNSYFAHKKLPVGQMCSGTTKVSWDGPNQRLLDFIKNICDECGFYSQAVDIFENIEGKFFVNEMQCFFGSENPHQMVLDGKPGRYIFNNSKWTFEKGNFNANNSYDLRLDHVLSLLLKSDGTYPY